jgi:hypothetical protein
MDNRINQIRRKIAVLRTSMLSLQDSIRVQVNRGFDCSEACRKLMTMRVQMVELIQVRDEMGGFEICPDIAGRLRRSRRVLGKRGSL